MVSAEIPERVDGIDRTPTIINLAEVQICLNSFFKNI